MNHFKKIGVFGGSFNPPHLGHLMAAIYALKKFRFDEIWLVPTFHHAFSKRLPPFQKRFKECKALIAQVGPNLKVSDIEKKIRSDGKMLLTLQALKKKYPKSKFQLVIGSDILKEKKRWYRFTEIKRKFGIAVVPRGKAKNGGFAIPNISSTKIRRNRSSRHR